MGVTFDPLLGKLRTTDRNALQTTSVLYVSATGNDSGSGQNWTAAKATISAAIAALPASGGHVKVGPGAFAVSSTKVRTDTVSYRSGNTFNDTSCIAGDVGSYVLWTNLGRVAQITAVVAGSYFTVDVLPTTTSATSATLVRPAIVIPEGVEVSGVGSNFNQQLTSGGSTSNVCTQITDFGTGVTVLIRGANAVSGNATRYGLSDISVLGNTGNMYGLFVGNGAWFVESTNLELSSHGLAGLALDGNINSHDFRNLVMYGNGTAGATLPTGGIVTHPYSAGGSASCNFYNPFFTSNYGFGICDGDAAGAYGVVLYSPQFNSTQVSARTRSGTSMVLQSNSYGRSVVVGGWSETASLYDVVTSGDVTVTGMRLHSGGTYHWLVIGGIAYAENCSFEGASIASVSLTSGGALTWNAVDTSDPQLYAGCPIPAPSMGTSAKLFGASLETNGAVVNGNLQVQDSGSAATKAYRFRTSGSGLDLDFAGTNIFLSGYPNADFTGTQHFYLGLNSGSADADAFGNWRYHEVPFGATVFDVLPGDPSINSYIYHEFHATIAHTGTLIGLYSATPVARATTAGTAATFVAGAGTTVNDASTFDGYTVKQVVKALRNIGILT